MAFDDIDWSQPQAPSAAAADMTPGPPPATPPPTPKPVTVMDKTWWSGADNPVPQDPATQRIRNAAWQAWTQTPDVLTPEAQASISRNVPLAGDYVINPAQSFISTLLRGANTVGSAGLATVGELADAAGLKGLSRDLAIIPQSIVPDAPALSSMANIPRLEPAGPRFAGGVTPEAVQTAEQRAAARNVVQPGGGPGPTSPTGIPGPTPPPPGYVPPTAPIAAPATAADAKTVASALYKKADATGGTLTPQFTNNWIDTAEKVLPQTQAGQLVGGKTETATLVDKLQTLRDQPLSLQAVQEVDEGLSGLISKEFNPQTGQLSKDGYALQDIQSSLRDQINNAGPNDISGDATGFDALSDARKAWQQAMKMSDVERIQQRAAMTDNPATSIRTQVKNLVTSPSRSRGWSDDELGALQDAASTGLGGNVMRVLGSRLVPIIATATGGPFPLNLAAGAGAEYVAGRFRDALANYHLNRLQNAARMLGQSVPQGAPTPAVAPSVVTQPVMPSLLAPSPYPAIPQQQQ